MTEGFLHYVWQHRLISQKNLKSDDGQKITIIHPGTLNSGAGPDFFNAQLLLNGIRWAGNVEIHIHASDWHRHNHHLDAVYDSCILHVVYENDAQTLRTDGSQIPTLQIRNRFPDYLWGNYLKLIGTEGWIPCQARIHEVDAHTWKKTFLYYLHEKLNDRAEQILNSVRLCNHNWDEEFYRQLARNFGFQLNAIPFEMLARSLPLICIMKERDKPDHVEALLFGQAGMLDEKFSDAYPVRLRNNYAHLQRKYALRKIPSTAWKYLRLRPVNFPTIRIAQLASLLMRNDTILTKITEARSVAEISVMLHGIASDYWNTHYQFDKLASYRVKKLGKSSQENLLINTCIPFLYAWGKYFDNPESCRKAVDFLSEISPEQNHIIGRWKELGIFAHSAVESQALLRLKLAHCSGKKCINCIVGNQLINILP